MSTNIFEFRSISFRKIPLFEQNIEKKYQNTDLIKRHIAIVELSELPLQFPRETNPREIKLTTRVARQIDESLRSQEFFHILNRGILISARSIKYDSKNSILTIDFGNKDDETDRELYGVVDGGHTYKIIEKYVESGAYKADSTLKYVNLEIFTGIDGGNNSVSITDFAAARNSSVPVDQKSLAELDSKFEEIKKAIKNQPYAEKIGYRQNSDSEIDIREIIAIMTVFDAEIYNINDMNNQPIKAYSQKEDCLRDYLSQYDIEKKSNTLSRYHKLCAILPKILELADYIRYRVPRIWNNDLKGKIGFKLNQITYDPSQPHFHFYPSLDDLLTNEVKNSKKIYDTRGKTWLWLPILAAMRVLVAYNDDKMAYFRTDPIEFFKSHEKDLVGILRDNCEKNFVPNRVGKDKTLWFSLLQSAWVKAVQAKIIPIN